VTLSGVINDRYQIERELGRGGMATVYLARDLRHGNRVALKVLSPDLASVVSGERFTREIRITAGLQHPHILPVFDSGQVDGLPYYVMPFVDGPTVEQRIKAGGPLPISEALEIACEVADALAHAHAEGFVHRDIKPSNILLAHGHAVVADFGIARAVEPVTTDRDLTKTGIAVGTAAYMSPEQSAGEVVDGRADIYSLGCVLYEMLAGKPPFAASTPRALMAKHWMNDVPSLRAVRRSVRASIEALVQKSMAKKPAQRYATAAEFEEALQLLSTEEKLVAAGFTPSEDQRVFRAGDPVPISNPAVSAVTEAMAANGFASSGALDTPTVSGDTTRTIVPTETAPNRARSRTMRNVIAGGILLAAGLGGWQLTRSGEQPLDRNRILVFPLLVPTDFTGSRNVGEDIGTMIGTALDGAGDLRWIDGWPLLTPAVRQDIRNLTAIDAQKIARSRRAAWYLTGRIVVHGDSSEVFLELNDVEGDSTVARSRSTGLTSDAWRIGLHAVNTLLPSLLPAGRGDVDILAEWTDRNPAAVASFLLAEGAFRRARAGDALEHYRAALRADSTFGLAAIRGAQAATWNHRSDEAVSFIERALRQSLPARYTHFARGYAAYLAGAADSAASEFRRVIALDPEMVVAWMQLGEVYVHLLPYKGNPDSLARAAFTEARRLDPDSKQILFHLLELRLRNGEASDAEPMMREFLAAQPDSVLARQVTLMHECLSAGPGAMDWNAAVGKSALATLSAANSLKGGGAFLDCARGGYEAVITSDTTQAAAGRRWAAVVGLASSFLAKGDAVQAKAVIDSAVARGQGGGSFFLMAAPLFPALRPAAEEVARRDELTYGRNFATTPYPLRLWQLAVWQVFAGRTEVADAIAKNLETRATTSGEPVDNRFARSARAFVTLARGDTTRAATAFKQLLSDPVPGTDIEWDVAAPRGIERLTLARLLLAEGDFQTAIQVANVFDAAWPSVHLLYLPGSLEVRAEAAAAISDNRLAAQFRNRLAALRGERVIAGSRTF
jgi:serine/threonine protein kinase/Flp pilus assembly protein TadD